MRGRVAYFVLPPAVKRTASNAGVFVANSAGNSGPGASTLDHPSPWLTTVAAATFRRAFQAVQLGNGARYVGASTTLPLNTLTPLILAQAAKLASAPEEDASLCVDGTLDPAKAAVPGFNTVVTPNRITLAPGAEKTFTVKFTRTTAALNTWAARTGHRLRS
jgi:hypothetical protein